VWIYTGKKFAKFHGNILSLSENIAKSFRGATFFDSHCIPTYYDDTDVIWDLLINNSLYGHVVDAIL